MIAGREGPTVQMGAAVVRAPLTGIALALSITANHALMLPVLATCLSAAVVSSTVGGPPIYAMLLQRTLRAQQGRGD
jgi:CIC family chloride channel protein